MLFRFGRGTSRVNKSPGDGRRGLTPIQNEFFRSFEKGWQANPDKIDPNFERAVDDGACGTSEFSREC